VRNKLKKGAIPSQNLSVCLLTLQMRDASIIIRRLERAAKRAIIKETM